VVNSYSPLALQQRALGAHSWQTLHIWTLITTAAAAAAAAALAGYGRLELVQLLLERGADISARNKQKLRPVDAAKMNGEVRGPHV
jgi:ankyrin repeat protein